MHVVVIHVSYKTGVKEKYQSLSLRGDNSIIERLFENDYAKSCVQGLASKKHSLCVLCTH